MQNTVLLIEKEGTLSIFIFSERKGIQRYYWYLEMSKNRTINKIREMYHEMRNGSLR